MIIKIIQRKEYLDNLTALKDKQVIKVITGVRRCGKSTLFELYIDHLKQTGVSDNQIISVNLEDLDNADLLDYKALYNHIKSKLITRNPFTNAVWEKRSVAYLFPNLFRIRIITFL